MLGEDVFGKLHCQVDDEKAIDSEKVIDNSSLFGDLIVKDPEKEKKTYPSETGKRIQFPQ